MNGLFYKAKYIYQQEGFASLLKKTFNVIPRLFYERGTYYLRTEILRRKNEIDYLPRIKNYILQIVTDTEKLSELIADGYDLSLLNISQAMYRLNKGAKATLISVDKELAYIGWMAMTEEAKSTFNNYPYKVDFDNGEVCIGDTLTNPKYRRLGLHTYAMFKQGEYLILNGAKKLITIILADNTVSLSAVEKHQVETIKKARYIRILCLKFWKEVPIG